MQYSLEILDVKKRWFAPGASQGRKILFVKVDCSGDEIAYLERNRLIPTVMFENYLGDQPAAAAGVWVYNKMSPNRDQEKKRKDDEYFLKAHTQTFTLGNLLAGAEIPLFEHQIPEAEQVIVDRIFAIGEPMKVTLQRGPYRGKTGNV